MVGKIVEIVFKGLVQGESLRVLAEGDLAP
jgi:hypothetical protein